MSRLLLVLSVLLVAGCSSTEEALTTISGLAVAASNATVATSFDRLTDALEAAGPVGIVAEVDHAANAAGAGLTLRPTRVVLFGNPMLGTPLMQANPLAGLDLPQKMLVYEAADGQVVVAYNTTAYLARRHGVGSVSTLGQVEGALSTFATVAAAGDGSVTIQTSGNDVTRDQGIVTVSSGANVTTTYSKLRTAIDQNPNLTIVAELDHQANAASVGLTLGASRLIVFGNPALGTPLMQAGQTAAIDLPQKMLVYEDGTGATFVAYNDPGTLATRHGLGSLEQVGTIRDALVGLAAQAVSVED